MFQRLRTKIRDRLAEAVTERVVARLGQSPEFADRIARQVVANQSADILGSDVFIERLVDRMTPAIAQRLVMTPVLFGGDWGRVTLGDGVQLVNTLMNVSSGRIVIGDQTFFGHNVSLITGTHPVTEKMSARHDYPRDGRDIVIGQGVWIASNAVVAGPCTVGDHAVIAAGAVVTCGQVDAGWLYGGVPARKIRKLV
ncbi:acyltransferase [Burkholderia cenocepacia]|uniref:Acyltransferase n=2 Tax=Burkholderia cenocepacia TaxID=95486 RepID=A0ABD4UIC6_9BURK|nr:acyltransferase [Burkholderia cenocepacia]MCW3697020.1 acyltransferase [Burkholderia cenocepacia]MCW3704753.1 acyltransferase [Burkholderia cenocepacia]MCW3714145.1 acyltransferase [Burkholderia cenocepacia]MCW3724483.1 acyltransferase [Burkholderia cenocepacia]MCW3732104.1 acyltransferase [Burkholderia cenocepacia]